MANSLTREPEFKRITTLDFPKIGIKKKVFNYFIDNICGGRQNIKDLTTTEVNEKYLIPCTLNEKLSYCDLLLKDKNNPNVGDGQVFISHAWKYVFLDVVDAIDYHFDDEIFIWFDLFSNNQHEAVELDFDWWTGTFKSNIQNFGHVVLILSPWTDPIPLHRAWCLYEIFCATITKAKFEIAMSRTDRYDFMKAISNSNLEPINKMIANIDVTQSDAYKESDRKSIFLCIENDVGFDSINKKVLSTLREWVISIMKNSLNTAERDNKEDMNTITNIQSSLGQIYYSHGHFNLSEPLLISVNEYRKSTFGYEDVKTIQSLGHLADLYHKMGQYLKADDLYKECIRLRKNISCEEDDDEITLTSKHKLARSLYDQTRIKESEMLLNEILIKREQLLGRDSSDTSSTMHDYALLLWKSGRYKEAEEMNLKCLESRKRVLGTMHPDTIETGRILGLIYWRQNRLKEATDVSNEAWRLMKIRLGDNSPETLHAHNQVALVLQSDGKYAEAIKIFGDCHKIRKLAFGENSPDTLHSLHGLASATLAKGDIMDAFNIFTNVLSLRKEVLGHEHLDTLHSIFGLACCLYHKGKFDESLSLHTSCLENRKTRLLSDEHPDIYRSLFEIAQCHYKLGNIETTIIILKECYYKRLNAFSDLNFETILTKERLNAIIKELKEKEDELKEDLGSEVPKKRKIDDEKD